LDDHRVWRDQLKAVSRSLTVGGLGLLALVVVATVASIIFATRGAMQSNREVIEVLDLVGAEPSYVARAFERHFLSLGLKAAILGGFLALGLFWGFALFGFGQGFGAVETNASSFLGHAGLGLLGHAGIIVAVATVALLTAITSRLTVSRHIRFAR
jgi:cell division transport system permease protein